ncbi:MAG: lysylphosphatidylglycerol synthase transmembrane domain-containing protein [Prosthecobacter sp.]
MKRLISISLRLIISGVLLFLLFREHDLIAEIAPRFREMLTNWHWVLGGLLFVFLCLLLTAVRWHILLRGFAPGLPFGVVMRAEVVSAFFNISSLGVVGGDAYKIMSLSRRLPGKTMPVGVSLVIDHLTGLVAVALLFAACIWAKASSWPQFGPNVRVLVTGYSMYVGGALVGLLLTWFSLRPDILTWGRRTFPRTFGLPMFETMIGKMAKMHGVFTLLWKRAFASMLVSIGMHVAFFMSFYCGLRAVGGQAPVLDVLTAMPIVDAAASLPLSVSGLGVRERTFEALLAGIAGVPDAVGVSASLAGWLFSLCWGLFGGLLFLRARSAEPAHQEAVAT